MARTALVVFFVVGGCALAHERPADAGADSFVAVDTAPADAAEPIACDGPIGSCSPDGRQIVLQVPRLSCTSSFDDPACVSVEIDARGSFDTPDSTCHTRPLDGTHLRIARCAAGSESTSVLFTLLERPSGTGHFGMVWLGPFAGDSCACVGVTAASGMLVGETVAGGSRFAQADVGEDAWTFFGEGARWRVTACAERFTPCP